MEMKVTIRITLFLYIALLLIGATAGQAAASSPQGVPAGTESTIEAQAAHLPVDKIESYWTELAGQYGGYFPDNRLPSFKELIMPGGSFGMSDLLQGLLKYFFFELLQSGKLLVSIVVLTVFSAVLQTLQGAFERTSISKVAYAICYLVIMIVAINSFNVAIGYARSAIESMIHFMTAMVPLLLSLLVSIGSIATASVLHPLIVFMIHIIGTLIYTIVFPLLFFSAVLHLVSAISDKYKVSQLADLMRKIGIGVLGFMLTVFLGVLSVQGATGAVMDGVTIRTAKYVTGNFVPVVGKMFTDAADSVIGASLLVKNAIGLFGVLVLVLLSAFPAIKILSLALIFNLSGAMMQPLGDSPIVSCLQTIGKNLIYVFAALAAVGLMFFFAMTTIIASGNIAVMMR